jgi:haloalkane dehalogenase
VDPGLRSSSERPSWLDERLFPFRSRFLDLDGCRVHYVDEGEGAPLLLLHGNPTWSFLYRDIIGGLRNRFRCVALDYPGFGLSGAREGYGYTPRSTRASSNCSSLPSTSPTLR